MKSTHALVGVIYEIDSQGVAGSFTVPDDMCQIIGVDKGSYVNVEVDSASGHHGPVRKQLVSDRQPSPVGEMSEWMAPRERIRVTVSKG
jgi:hypothetical protein